MKLSKVFNIYTVIGFILVVNLGTLVVLRFGNPQWDKYIYIFQAKYWPKHKDGIINPPKYFTGIWKNWYSNGNLATRLKYENGLPNGTFMIWDKEKIILAKLNLKIKEEPFLKEEISRGFKITAWSKRNVGLGSLYLKILILQSDRIMERLKKELLLMNNTGCSMGRLENWKK